MVRMMPLPKPEFADFYRFVVSIGIILIILPFLTIILAASQLFGHSTSNWQIVLFALLALSAVLGILISCWAGARWFTNQKRLDEKLRAEEMEAIHKMGKMTEEERTRDIEEHVEEAQVSEALIAAEEPTLPPPHTRDAGRALRNIELFKATKSRRKLLGILRRIENSALDYLNMFYPGMETHVAVDSPVGRITFDGVVTLERRIRVVEIRIFKGKTLQMNTEAVVDRLKARISALDRALFQPGGHKEIDVIVAAVCDHAIVEIGERRNLKRRLYDAGLRAGISIETVFIDLKALDIWDSDMSELEAW